METAEHAKTRVLIMIDQIVCCSQYSAGEKSVPNMLIPAASASCRYPETRTFATHFDLWTSSEEHQAYRIGNKHSHLLSATFSEDIWIHSIRGDA